MQHLRLPEIDGGGNASTLKSMRWPVGGATLLADGSCAASRAHLAAAGCRCSMRQRGARFVAPLFRMLSVLVLASWVPSVWGQGNDAAAPEASETAGVLRSVETIRQLSAQAAAERPPVHVGGVVTFSHPTDRYFYLQDATAGICVYPSPDMVASPPAVGQSVVVQGVGAAATFGPAIQARSIAIVGPTELPPAKRITVDEALKGREHGQWVEMLGNLRSMRVTDGWVRIVVQTFNGDVSATYPGEELPQLAPGSMVRIRGVCVNWSNNHHQFGGIFLFLASAAQIVPADPLPATQEEAMLAVSVLRRVDAVIALQGAHAVAERKADLRGVVTFAHVTERYLFLHDGSGSVRVTVAESMQDPLPGPGTEVRVSGRVVGGDYSPAIHAGSITTVGRAVLPIPRSITYEHALSGLEDSQWVELRGTLVEVEVMDGWLRMRMAAATGEFLVSIPGDEPPGVIPGSLLRVRGVCVAWSNRKGQLGGIYLLVPSPREVEVLDAAPTDPFAVPAESVGALPKYQFAQDRRRAVRVRGVVMHHVPGRYLYLASEAGSVRVLSRLEDPLMPGDDVEAAGLPRSDGQKAVLREAVYRRLGRGEPPAPFQSDGSVLPLDPGLDGRLVALAGTILDVSTHGSETRLFIQSGASVRSVFLEGELPSEQAAAWLPGSLASVVGLYHIKFDDADAPEDFAIQLRSSDDLRIDRPPPWWTPRRALGLTGALAVAVTAGLAWVAALRRRVRRQTAQIREQLLKEANLEARHREIVEHASDFIFTTALDGRITSFNPAGQRITGYTREEALRLNLRDLIAEEDRARGTAALSVVSESPETETATARFETRFVTRDGRHVWVETCARLILEDGRAAGVLGIVRDISDRKQIEEELKRARDAAETNTRAKSAFLANMSHEIRTPMGGVIGMTNLLLDTPLRSDQREFAETIRASAEALLTVLNDILDFSKIEAGRLELESIPFSPAPLVDEIVGLLATRASSRGIELAAYVSPAVPAAVSGDAGRLRQVLLNLVGNAIKFTEQGEVTLTVTCEPDVAETLRLRFEVTDTGIGMDEATQARLFQPFNQADASTTRRFGGTGLGLAISRQIVAHMGGSIGVRSRPGAGSTFWFVVPFPRIAECEPADDLSALRGVRVLLVDDNATVRRIGHDYLTAWAMRCDCAESSSSALDHYMGAAATADPCRVVLVEHALPLDGGLALIRSIRATAGGADAVIFLLATFERHFGPEELASLGIDGVLTKPLRQADMRARFLHALGGAAGADSRASEPVAAEPVPKELDHLRVIVAEDNIVNQRLVQLQLRKLGIEARIVAHGRALLDELAREPFDVVLMDCQMPEMDGFEATRCIRSSPEFSGLHIIAMTANAMEGDRDRCLDAGMDDYLTKPARGEDLRLKLAAFTRRRAAGSGLVSAICRQP